ncbi:MAG: site-2 protease family protein [Flavobacteriales bacterium]|nr:site-2 protease family protein [Flavobacteriales bacterium]
MSSSGFGSKFPLFAFKGIRVFVHWTFLLLVGYIAITAFLEGASPLDIGKQVFFLLIVFLCVIMHEYGHALMALRYGVRTKDITLLPIGGVARLERMPEEPIQEFWITVAGPAVNLVLVALAILLQFAFYDGLFLTDPTTSGDLGEQLLTLLLGVNLALFLFNLVPAFPMDGGRILRSVLGMRLPRLQATRIASAVGRFFAIAFVVFGLATGRPLLALIGVFIYIGAVGEARMAGQQAALRNVRIRQVMRSRFWSMDGQRTVSEAVDELLAGGDEDVVITHADAYQGVVRRKALVQALQVGDREKRLDQLDMDRIPAAGPDDPAYAIYERMLASGWPLVPVVEQGRVVGVLEPTNMSEFIMVQQASAPGSGR